jgi:hypothetical protein
MIASEGSADWSWRTLPSAPVDYRLPLHIEGIPEVGQERAEVADVTVLIPTVSLFDGLQNVIADAYQQFNGIDAYGVPLSEGMKSLNCTLPSGWMAIIVAQRCGR